MISSIFLQYFVPIILYFNMANFDFIIVKLDWDFQLVQNEVSASTTWCNNFVKTLKTSTIELKC